MPDKNNRGGSPYDEFLAELDEIQRLKWLASEEEKRDIGFEAALNLWARQHRQMWRKVRNATQKEAAK